MPSTELLIHVAAAAVVDERGQVLLARRPDHAHQGGLWEFPGGKLEPGETVREALQREIREEVGIELGTARPLIRIRHSYPERTVLLDVWRASDYDGIPEGKEGQRLEWVAIDDLDHWPMPPADVPIVTALRLPELYLITDDADGNPVRFLNLLDAALARGVRLVQLRAKSLDGTAFCSLAAAAIERCRSKGARILLNAEPELVAELGADGVHLNGERLRQLVARPLPKSLLVAASCHDGEDLAQAQRIGADFAVLSPVLPTVSHPHARPLGWQRFSELVEAATLPVFGLGGLGPEQVVEAQARGGQGIAAIRSLWRPAT